MHINWDLVIRIAIPFVTLFLGIVLTKRFEDRPQLITYITHASGIRSKTPDGHDVNVNMHSMVVRNTGRKSATNVRLGHRTLPAFQIYPSIDYTVKELHDKSKEIIIPTLVPKKQITINYLYFPPLLVNQINTYTESDQGSAKAVNMILTRQLSKRTGFALALVLLLGFVALGYLLVLGIEALARIL